MTHKFSMDALKELKEEAVKASQIGRDPNVLEQYSQLGEALNRIISDVESVQKEILDTEQNAQLLPDVYNTSSTLSVLYPTGENKDVDAATIETVTRIKEERLVKKQVREMIQAIEDTIAKNIDDRDNKAILEKERGELLKSMGELQEADNKLDEKKTAFEIANKVIDRSKSKVTLTKAKHETSVLKIEAVQAAIKELQSYINELKMGIEENARTEEEEKDKIRKSVCEKKKVCIDQIEAEIAFREFLIEKSKDYIYGEAVDDETFKKDLDKARKNPIRGKSKQGIKKRTIMGPLKPFAKALTETQSEEGRKFIVDGKEVRVNYEDPEYARNRNVLLDRVNRKIAFVKSEIIADEEKIKKLQNQKSQLNKCLDKAVKEYDDKIDCQKLRIKETEDELNKLYEKLEDVKQNELSKKTAVEDAEKALQKSEEAVKPLADEVTAAEAEVTAKEAIVIAKSNRVKYMVAELVDAYDAELNNAIEEGFEDIFAPLDKEEPLTK